MIVLKQFVDNFEKGNKKETTIFNNELKKTKKQKELFFKILNNMKFDKEQKSDPYYGYYPSQLGFFGLGEFKKNKHSQELILRTAQGSAFAIGKTLNKMEQLKLIVRKTTYTDEWLWFKTTIGLKIEEEYSQYFKIESTNNNEKN